VAAYARAKARIFAKAATVVLNADDPLGRGDARLGGAAQRPRTPAARIVTFSIARPTPISRCCARDGTLLARRGVGLLDIARMKITGLHNAANALAALALGEAAGLPMPPCSRRSSPFPGLPHRSEWVADVAGVRYIDDSKGTNVGATIAAVAGMQGPLVMIAGGEGKGQDFAPLAEAFAARFAMWC
jgi:UDP-N-acetylmuramoylalanine--D-glutamate ligase